MTSKLPVRALHERQCDGDPPPREDGVGGGIGMEPGGAGLRLSPHDFILLLLRLPMVRDERVVDGDLERTLREQAGCLLGEQSVRPLEQRPHGKAAEAVSDHALARSAFVLLAYPARGCLPRRGEREHARHVLRGVLALEPPAQEPQNPEHGHLDDLLGGDPFPGAMIICPTSTCSFGALRGSAIPSLRHRFHKHWHGRDGS